MAEYVEHYKKQIKIFNWITVFCTVYVAIILIIDCIFLHEDSELKEVWTRGILPCIFFGLIIIVTTLTIVRFCILRRKHTINFNTCTLANIALFIICFFIEQLLADFMHECLKQTTENTNYDSKIGISQSIYDENMSIMNTYYLAYTIDRFVMFIFLSILLINLQKSIDQFIPESKTVQLNELVKKYQRDDEDSVDAG